MIRSSVLLPDAVQAEHADLRAGKKRQPDVLREHVVGRMDLSQTFHGVDELRHLFLLMLFCLNAEARRRREIR